MEKVPVIEVANLTARFGDDVIFTKVGFQVFKGEILAVLGGSGCGKSTLLKHMIGLYRPHTGRVLINGVDVNSNNTRELHKIKRWTSGCSSSPGPSSAP